jgi:hypothetical protein
MARGAADRTTVSRQGLGDDGGSWVVVGPGNGVDGDGWLSCATVAANSRTNSTINVMAVARRTRAG